MKVKSTKKALIASVLMLALCFSMLVGTTFAWFTDSVSSSGNKIVAGTLDIDLVDKNGNTLAGEMIEWAAKDGRAQNEIYWEPGCTYETEEFYIVNKGNLNLKFKFDVTGIDGDAKLLEVVDFECLADASWFEFNVGGYGITPAAGTTFDILKGYEMSEDIVYDEYKIAPGQKVGPFSLSGHMDELAGNEYMGLTIEGIAVSLIATQAIGDEDSFDGIYDINAQYSQYSKGSAVVFVDENGDLRIKDTATDSMGNTETKNDYVKMVDTNKGNLVGSVYVPSAAIAEGATSVDVVYMETATDPNFTVADGYEVMTFDVSVTGIKNVANDGNIFKVEMNIGAGRGDYVEVYHYGNLLKSDYDNGTGMLTFDTDSFSPFNIVYNYEEAKVNENAGLPKAEVTDVSETYADKNLEWKSFDKINKLPKGYQLQTVYNFKAKDTATTVKESPYKNWFCDYYVSVNKDIKAGDVVLGGNYGNYGWVGFENPVDIKANTAIPLLGYFVAENGAEPRRDVITYEDIVIFVDEFLCGVAYTHESVAGVEFKVELRLTNPDNLNDQITVETITYTFGENNKAPMKWQDYANNPYYDFKADE